MPPFDPRYPWPGRIPAGTATDALSQNVDIFPTMAGMLGVDKSSLTGRDLTPVMTGQSTPVSLILPPRIMWVAMAAGRETVRDIDESPHGIPKSTMVAVMCSFLPSAYSATKS